MKPETKLKYAILSLQAVWDDKEIPDSLTEEEVEDLWDEADCLQDAKSEIRCGDVETNVECDDSRHYESKSVAAQCPNGEWVGWTYWFGGGKYGEPEAIDWIEYAYDLDCVEEQKMVTVRTFTKKREE